MRKATGASTSRAARAARSAAGAAAATAPGSTSGSGAGVAAACTSGKGFGSGAGRQGSQRAMPRRVAGRSRSKRASMASCARLIAPVSTRYSRPEAKKTGKKSKVDEASCELRSVSSCTAMTEASEEFFSVLTVSLPIAGIMERSACGAMMRRISTRGVMPRAWPASTWPRSTPTTPERNISAMKVASLKASAMPAASSPGNLMPTCGSAF